MLSAVFHSLMLKWSVMMVRKSCLFVLLNQNLSIRNLFSISLHLGSSCSWIVLPDAFAKLRKAIITFVMSVCLSIQLLVSKRTDFHEICISVLFFSKISRESSIFTKHEKNSGYFTWRPMYIYDNNSVSSS